MSSHRVWALAARKSTWRSRSFAAAELFSAEIRSCLRHAVRVDIDDEVGPSQKTEDNPRVGNRFARFCWRNSLDRLWQLLNIFSGEESCMGPESVTPAEVAEFNGSRSERVLAAKPGLLGLQQISRQNRISTKERCRLDLGRIGKRPMGTYRLSLARSLSRSLTGESAW